MHKIIVLTILNSMLNSCWRAVSSSNFSPTN